MPETAVLLATAVSRNQNETENICQTQHFPRTVEPLASLILFSYSRQFSIKSLVRSQRRVLAVRTHVSMPDQFFWGMHSRATPAARKTNSGALCLVLLQMCVV
jgi:hypothetical protein